MRTESRSSYSSSHLEMPLKSEGIATQILQLPSGGWLRELETPLKSEGIATDFFFAFHNQLPPYCLKRPKKVEGLRLKVYVVKSQISSIAWNALKKWRDFNIIMSPTAIKAFAAAWNALKKWRDFNLNHQFRSFKNWKAIFIRQKGTLKLLFCSIQTVITTMLFQGSITHLEAWPL